MRMSQLLLASMLAAFLGISKEFRIPGSEQQTDVVSVEIQADATHNRHRRQFSDSLPDKMAVSISSDKIGDISLFLHRDVTVDVNAPVFVQRVINGTTNVFKESASRIENCGLYTSREDGGTFMIEAVDDTETTHSTSYELFGYFYAGSQGYTVQSSNRSDGTYFMEKMAENTQNWQDHIRAEGIPSTKKKMPFQRRRHRRRVNQTEFIVELLCVADYSMYNFWYEKSSKVSDSERKEEAKKLIRQFFAVTINGINLYFKSVIEKGYTISVAFAGMLLSETASDSAWTSSIADTTVDPTRVDGYMALYKFKLWVIANKAQLPVHDHAMLFTRFDLEHGGNPGLLGRGYVDSLCSYKSQSICESRHLSILHYIATHELAHSLGAGHDGLGNKCPASEGHVMSPSHRLSGGNRNRNQWTFSSCTQDDFDDFIDNLGDNNCMTDFGPSFDANLVSDDSQKLDGQRFPPDIQCTDKFGGKYQLCRGCTNGNYTGICGMMQCCSSPDTCQDMAPLEGTSCGSGKLCSNGSCVPHYFAPSLSETCPFGDQLVAGSGMTCRRMVKSAPYLCYDHRHDCCNSCSKVFTGVTGCEFGDKLEDCNSESCDESEMMERCCETCALVSKV